jgi:hypothetical protein
MKYNFATKLKFFDLKAKKTFMTDKYSVRMKGPRKFAVAKAPSGIPAWRIMSKKK